MIRLRDLLICLPTMLIATYPLATVIAANGGVGWILAFFVTYAFVVLGLQALGARVTLDSAGTAIVYVVSTVAVVTLWLRPWHVRPRDPMPLSVVSVGLVLMNLSVGGFSILKGWDGPWRGAADALIQSSLAGSTPNVAAAPRDVSTWFSMASADILQSHYGPRARRRPRGSSHPPQSVPVLACHGVTPRHAACDPLIARRKAWLGS